MLYFPVPGLHRVSEAGDLPDLVTHHPPQLLVLALHLVPGELGREIHDGAGPGGDGRTVDGVQVEIKTHRVHTPIGPLPLNSLKLCQVPLPSLDVTATVLKLFNHFERIANYNAMDTRNWPDATNLIVIVRHEGSGAWDSCPGSVVRVGLLAEEHELPVVVPLAGHDGPLTQFVLDWFVRLDVGPGPHGDGHGLSVLASNPFLLYTLVLLHHNHLKFYHL